MDETLNEQLTTAATRLAVAAEALENAVTRLDTQHQELSSKVDRIVAALDDNAGGPSFRPFLAEDGNTEVAELQARVAELERTNSDLKAQASRTARKTLSPLVTAVLAKNDGEGLDSVALDRTLASLSVDQRIAVKAEMAKAGIIE